MRNILFFLSLVFYQNIFSMLNKSTSFEKMTVKAVDTHPFLFKLSNRLGPVSLELKNVEQLRLIIDVNNELNIDEPAAEKQTILHYLATKQVQELYPLLLALGANVNAKDSRFNTPLHIATEKGNTYVFNLLIKNKADVNAKNNEKNTPLHLAARQGYTEMVNTLICMKELLEPGRNKSFNNPLDELIEFTSNSDVAKLLIDKGICPINEKDFSPLLKACVLNKLNIIKLFMEHPGLNVNATDVSGNGPLHIAVLKNSLPMIELFLTHKHIDVNLRNEKGLTPLMMAVKRDSIELVKALASDARIELDIVVSENEYKFYSALYFAFKNKNADIFKFLVFRNARTTLPTPESCKIQELFKTYPKKKKKFFKKFSTLKLAKERYLQLEKEDSMRSSIEMHQALFEAINKKDIQAIKKIACKTTLNQYSSSWDTPLHMVVKTYNQDYDLELFFLVLYLNPAQLNAKNKDGLTPLKLLINSEKKNLELLEILLKKLFEKFYHTGVSAKLQEKIISLIKALDPQSKIFLYGDRAREKFSENSPIQLVIDCRSKELFQEIKKVFAAIDENLSIAIEDYNVLSKKEKDSVLANGILWYDPAVQEE